MHVWTEKQKGCPSAGQKRGSILGTNTEKENNFEKALTYSFRLLKIRERSEQELIEKLKKKFLNSEICARVVKHLKRNSLVNDEHFAFAWADTKMLLNPAGPAKLYYELKEKGVQPPIIEKTLHELEDKYDFKETALKLAQKRLKPADKKDTARLKKRIYDYLKRKGFVPETIFYVLNEIFGVKEDNES